MNNKIEVISNNDYRFYLINGIAHASNTSVLKIFNKEKIQDYNVRKTIAFIVKRGNLSKETVSLAYGYYKRDLLNLAEQGTDKHKLASDFLKYGKYIKDPWLDRFIKWKEKEGFQTRPDLVEKVLFNSKYRIAGTCDMIGKIADTIIGIDIKTSSGIYNTHKIQCCGYNHMLKNSIKWAVLDIPRDASKTDFNILTQEEQQVYENVFLSLNDAFQKLWKNGDLGVDIPY